jgi:ureidoglycolate hydrolase
VTITIATRHLTAHPVTASDFAPFGAVLRALPDRTPMTSDEELLDLSNGRPRFYLMELHDKPPVFRAITRHRRTTQVLLGVGDRGWVIAVAPPTGLDDPDAVPDLDAIRAFWIPSDVAVLLSRGTWHSGPHFLEPTRSFASLELADTNIVDHHTFRIDEAHNVQFEIGVEADGHRVAATTR